MSDRNYYVICDDNCKFPAMTKEQVIAAIAEATGHTVEDIDAAFITKIKEQNKNLPLKFWIGTQAEYNALQEKDANTFYIFTDEDDFSFLTNVAEKVENSPHLYRELWNGELSVDQSTTHAEVGVPNITAYKFIVVYDIYGNSYVFQRDDGYKHCFINTTFDPLMDYDTYKSFGQTIRRIGIVTDIESGSFPIEYDRIYIDYSEGGMSWQEMEIQYNNDGKAFPSSQIQDVTITSIIGII